MLYLACAITLTFSIQRLKGKHVYYYFFLSSGWYFILKVHLSRALIFIIIFVSRVIIIRYCLLLLHSWLPICVVFHYSSSFSRAVLYHVAGSLVGIVSVHRKCTRWRVPGWRRTELYRDWFRTHRETPLLMTIAGARLRSMRGFLQDWNRKR